MSQNNLELTAAHARPGLPIGYHLKINDKKIWTYGFVTKAVKTGNTEIQVTLRHGSTGEEFTNTLHADKTVWLHKPTMAEANPYLFRHPLTSAKTTLSITNGRAYFFEAEIGAELSQESSMPPGVKPRTIIF